MNLTLHAIPFLIYHPEISSLMCHNHVLIVFLAHVVMMTQFLQCLCLTPISKLNRSCNFTNMLLWMRKKSLHFISQQTFHEKGNLKVFHYIHFMVNERCKYFHNNSPTSDPLSTKSYPQGQEPTMLLAYIDEGIILHGHKPMMFADTRNM